MNAMVSTGAAYPDLSGPITGTVMSGWRPFDMVVNLKTARILGIEIPALIVAQANVVIE